MASTRPSLLAALALVGSSAVSFGQGVEGTVLRVRAIVDGRSQLVLDGATARWEHFDWAAPGRHFSNRGEVEEATYLSGIAWYPIWPDAADSENRWCKCESDLFTGLIPAIPEREWTAALEVMEGRGKTAIVEQPTAANGYRVVIEFDDNAPGGPAWYEVVLRIGCEVARTCEATPNSSGTAANLALLGSLSIDQNEAWLEVVGCPPHEVGMLVSGPVRADVPFGDGLLCVGPAGAGLRRVAHPVTTDFAGQASQRLQPRALARSGELAPGTTWHFQFLFGDSGAQGAGFNTSNALQATFCP